MATNRLVSGGKGGGGRVRKPKTGRREEPRLVKLWDHFVDPCPFSIMLNDDGSYRIEAGEVAEAVTVFHTAADSLDDDGWGDAVQALEEATGLKQGEYRLLNLELPHQGMFLPWVIGAAIIGYRQGGGHGYPSAAEVAKDTGFPLPMVKAGLAEYQRAYG